MFKMNAGLNKNVPQSILKIESYDVDIKKCICGSTLDSQLAYFCHARPRRQTSPPTVSF